MSSHSDDITDSLNHLSLAEGDDGATAALTAQTDRTAEEIQHADRVFPGIRGSDDFPTNSSFALDNGMMPEARHFEGGSIQHGAPFPVFLTDSSVRGAIQRADALHQQRYGHPAVFPPTLDRTGQSLGMAENLGRPPYPVSHTPALTSSSVLQPEKGSVSGDPVPSKFTVPGQETASVLQISKRPRLRKKDIAHRQSLISSGAGVSSPALLDGTHLSPTPASHLRLANPVFTPPRLGEYPFSQRASNDNFMVLLCFG